MGYIHLSDANAVDDDAGIDGRDRHRLRARRNRNINAYEVVLDGDGADGILLADVGVAARHLDVFRLAVVERILSRVKRMEDRERAASRVPKALQKVHARLARGPEECKV